MVIVVIVLKLLGVITAMVFISIMRMMSICHPCIFHSITCSTGISMMIRKPVYLGCIGIPLRLNSHIAVVVVTAIGHK